MNWYTYKNTNLPKK